jgi:hypothetical protein
MRFSELKMVMFCKNTCLICDARYQKIIEAKGKEKLWDEMKKEFGGDSKLRVRNGEWVVNAL